MLVSVYEHDSSSTQCNTYVHAYVYSMVYVLTTRSIYVQPWSHECLAHMKCLLSLLHSSVYTCVDGNLLGLVNSRQWLDHDHCSQATATRGYLLSLLTFTPLALLSSADSTIYVTFFELHIKQETAHTHTCIHVHTCTHTLIRTPSHAYVHTQTCTHTRKAEYITKFEAHKAQRPLVTMLTCTFKPIPHHSIKHMLTVAVVTIPIAQDSVWGGVLRGIIKQHSHSEKVFELKWVWWVG